MPPQPDSLLEAGIFFFNEGRLFDAHEAWEDLWRRTTGPERLFYQGLIQAAVGLHHRSRENYRGARAQLLKALAKLETYADNFCGIDNAKLVRDLRGALQGGE